MCGRLSQIALGADIRISARDCRFSIMEAKWGLIPDMSATVTLRDLVPKDVALELVGVFVILLRLNSQFHCTGSILFSDAQLLLTCLSCGGRL
jgi:enoyl-CoA hydratase/carnithine racemase